ncbi:hypothetical protein ETI05_01355 [Macrococcoides canis]|uniref:hypothetical protein n=1 Tax=Macrococcoides canis TaxID=1855823 RepID=UPI0010615BB7|nr:hypothetical protein [Macrococcus canis]TDM21415.1 hypothetical protein ETI05_01355 [Macrococcus canis]TDM23711.1 hypothetical protein ETI02_04745 [Macrococcus canis]TDM38487.1 hypothetical protein ETI11_03600 [Macrococcus canis]
MAINTEKLIEVLPKLNNTEQVYLSLLAERGLNINRDSIRTEIVLPNLVEADIIPATKGAMFFMPIEMINIYNQHVLNSEFPEIKHPSEEEIENESAAFEKNIAQYNEQMKREAEIDQMIQMHGNQPLKKHLNHLALEDLNAIAMFYQLDINDDKQTQINIIHESFFKDFRMLDKMLKYMDYELLLNIENALQFDYDNFTYMKGATREIFLYAPTFNEILFLPSDVAKHIKAYKKQMGYFNQDIEKIKFYRGLLNIYGFVRIDIMQQVYQKLYQEELTRETILKDIQTFFPNLVPNIKGNWIKHELYSHQQLNLDEIFSNMEYYIPQSKEAVYKYILNAYVEPGKNTRELKMELKRNMKGEVIYNQQVEALYFEIIETFRVTDSFETAFEFIADLGAKNMISVVPTERLTRLLKDVYTEVRLWRLGGKKVSEMPEFKRSKIQVVQKKSKKKKKKK